MTVRITYLCIGLLLASCANAFAVGTQFNGSCDSFTWTQNQEQDLAGYKIYDRIDPSAPRTLKVTLGAQISTVACSSLGLNSGQHYMSISAFDASGNESPQTADIPFVIILDNQVGDLRVTVINATDMTLAFTEVTDGLVSPASYDVRFKTPTMDWGTAASVTSGTCATPLAGVTIGATKTCTVTGLSATTPYEFQLVPFRGTIGVDAIYGPLSNVTGGTTGGSIDDLGDRTIIAAFTFTQSDGSPGSPWEGGYSTGTPTNDIQVVSNRIRGTSITQDSLMTINTALPDDQWCEIVISTITGSGSRVPRCILAANAPGSFNGYEFAALVGVSGTKTRISAWTNGQWQGNLASDNTTNWVSGDVLRAEKRGASLTLYRNGTLVLTVSDSTYSGGRGGVIIYPGAAVANVEVDNVRFGTFAAATADGCGC